MSRIDPLDAVKSLSRERRKGIAIEEWDEIDQEPIFPLEDQLLSLDEEIRMAEDELVRVHKELKEAKEQVRLNRKEFKKIESLKGKENFFGLMHWVFKWGGISFLVLLFFGPAWPSIQYFLEDFPASKVFFLALTIALVAFSVPLYKRIQKK